MNAPAKLGLLVQGAPGSVPGDGSVPVGHPAVRARKIGVLLVNLGTPDAPDAPAVRRYLKQFLSDPRVIEIPRLLWQPILRGIILNVRPKKSAHAYGQVWSEEGSPLAAITARQAANIELSRFSRAASEGFSSIATTSSAWTISRPSASGSRTSRLPKRTGSMLSERAASAPATISSGARSPPIASTATRIFMGYGAGVSSGSTSRPR